MPPPASAQNRKKKSWIGWVVLVCAIAIGGVFGNFLGRSLANSTESSKKQDYQIENMTITLPEGFKKDEIDSFTGAYIKGDIAVFALRETYEQYAAYLDGMETWTAEEYAELSAQYNDIDEVKTRDGLYYFDYTYDGEGVPAPYHYIAFSYKDTEGFWLVQFCTPEKNYAKVEQQFFDWAKTVRFE